MPNDKLPLAISEQHILNLCTRRYMRYETITKKADSSIVNLPNIINSLVAKGLIEAHPDIYQAFTKYRLTETGKVEKELGGINVE